MLGAPPTRGSDCSHRGWWHCALSGQALSQICTWLARP